MNEVMSIKELSAALRDENWMDVTRETGVAYDTIRLIVRKPDEANPQWKTLKAFTEYVRG